MKQNDRRDDGIIDRDDDIIDLGVASVETKGFENLPEEIGAFEEVGSLSE